MADILEQDQDAPGDERLPYERPDLLDAGQIADLTLSNGNNSGGDGAYS